MSALGWLWGMAALAALWFWAETFCERAEKTARDLWALREGEMRLLAALLGDGRVDEARRELADIILGIDGVSEAAAAEARWAARQRRQAA